MPIAFTIVATVHNGKIMKPVSLHLRVFSVGSAVENREVTSSKDCPVTFGQSCFGFVSNHKYDWYSQRFVL